MKPVILITLHRRYEDLAKNLEIINSFRHEFVTDPDIGIVWADPELDMEWFLNEQIEKHDNITFIIYRPKLDGEGQRGGTTYPESHNIVYGLKFIRDAYDDVYAIVQATDAYPFRNAYREIDGHMNDKHNAVLYYWHHNCLSVPGFCTYFFAIQMEEQHWPPISDGDNHDALEWQWAKIIYEITKVEGRKPFGYTAYPPNRRFEVGNLPCGTIYRRNKNDLNLFITGTINEGFVNWCVQRWNRIQSWCYRICQSIKQRF